MVMMRRTRGHKLYQLVLASIIPRLLSPGHLPQDLVMEGSKRVGDIRIDVSIDIESMF